MSVEQYPVARSKRETEYRYGIALALVAASLGLFMLGGDFKFLWVTAVALQVAALVAVYHTADLSPFIRWGTRGASVFMALVLYLSLLASPDVVRVTAGVIGLTLTVTLAANLLRAIAIQPVVDSRTILGAITVYVVIGLFFAELYWTTAALSEGAFLSKADLTLADCTYFSYVTLTTVGFGDLSPATGIARTMAVGEAMLGQLYLVTVLAVIVSNLGKKRDPGGDDR